MSTFVKKLLNQKTIIFDQGKFDEWCVYVVEVDGRKKAPIDERYFNDLYHMSKKYKPNKVYEDFLQIYVLTDKTINNDVLKLIDEIALSYQPADKTLIEQWFTVIYAGMIAEENKQNAVLKKRIKRLGLYQVLALNIPAKEASKFSLGKKWQDLDALMKEYGF